MQTLEDGHGNTLTPLPQIEYNSIIARDTSIFQHNEVIPFIFLCLALLTRAASLHLKGLMNPLGFYLSMPLVAALQGQPQATDVIRLRRLISLFVVSLSAVILFSYCLLFNPHRDKSFVSTRT